MTIYYQIYFHLLWNHKIEFLFFRVNEVLEEPDIMGDLRDAVETFYKRDHVEIIEETQLKEMTFLTDINFTHQMMW